MASARLPGKVPLPGLHPICSCLKWCVHILQKQRASQLFRLLDIISRTRSDSRRRMSKGAGDSGSRQNSIHLQLLRQVRQTQGHRSSQVWAPQGLLHLIHSPLFMKLMQKHQEGRTVLRDRLRVHLFHMLGGHPGWHTGPFVHSPSLHGGQRTMIF